MPIFEILILVVNVLTIDSGLSTQFWNELVGYEF